ncbi:uncharacterized protein G2W53_000574 [Senna tora]|uniref:Uncharacterized protein n=1 Tax=Senna tora TaxID=362788 RepID=A0A834XE60_9FABA|nr:uncharacterized protein G2W53_000574 [Senna tora]
MAGGEDLAVLGENDKGGLRMAEEREFGGFAEEA